MIFFPLRHEQKLHRLPAATIGIIAVNCLVFLFFFLSLDQETRNVAEGRQKLCVDGMVIIEYMAKSDLLFKPLEQVFHREKFEQAAESRDIDIFLSTLQEEFQACLKRRDVQRQKEYVELMQEWLQDYQSLLTKQKNSILNFIGFVPNSFLHLGFLTHIFLHGGWLHLAFNMWILFIVGSVLEDTWGQVHFLLFYLFGGLFAGFAHYLSDIHSAIPMVGASGAIAAVMGAVAISHYKAPIRCLFVYWFGLLYVRTVLIPAWIFLSYGSAANSSKPTSPSNITFSPVSLSGPTSAASFSASPTASS